MGPGPDLAAHAGVHCGVGFAEFDPQQERRRDHESLDAHLGANHLDFDLDGHHLGSNLHALPFDANLSAPQEDEVRKEGRKVEGRKEGSWRRERRQRKEGR